MNIFRSEAKEFLNSFRTLRRKYLYMIGIDVISIRIIVLLGTLLNYLLVGQLLSATGGTTGQDLTTILLSMSNAELGAVADSLRVFLFTLIGGFILFGIASLLISGYSRKLMWEKVVGSKKPSKISFRDILGWSSYILALGILSTIVMYVGYLLVFLLVALLFFWDTSQISTVVQQILSIGLITLILNFTFLAFRNFSTSKKVWPSLGKTFKIVWNNKGRILLRSLIQSITFVAVVFLIGFAAVRLFNAYAYVQIIQWIFYALFLSWIRWYYVQTIKTQKV